MLRKYCVYLLLLFFIFFGCSSTGVREKRLLSADSENYANIYFKRLYHVLYYTAQAYIVINDKEIGSLYQGEFQKIFLEPGTHKISVYGGLLSFNPSEILNKKTPIQMYFEKGKNYYFVIQAAWDGPYRIKQVDQINFDKLVWGEPF